MQISAATTLASAAKVDVLLVPAFEGKDPLAGFSYGEDLAASIVDGLFTGKAGDCVMVAAGKGVAAKSVIVFGLGKQDESDLAALRNGVCAALRNPSIAKLKYKTAAIDLANMLSAIGTGKKVAAPGASDTLTEDNAYWVGQGVAEGAELGVYAYTKLFNKNEAKLEAASTLTKFTAYSKVGNAELKKGLSAGQDTSHGVNLARDLCNDPNSHLMPADLAKVAMDQAKAIPGLSCKVLLKPELQKLKMGAFLSVNAGSNSTNGAARLICLEYKGGKKSDKPLCFVGKGLTFDTGGYSLKPAASMLGMKWDMGGAATVLGAICVIAKMKLPLNVVCVIPTTENLVNEEATKPGDVVTSMAGITIEVNNTDAEGRLALCDALTYAQKTYKPDTIVDAATLTGAVLVALGDQMFGVMSNDDGVAGEIATATKDAAELSWRLPLPKEYDAELDSTIADVSNIGGRCGTITAGLFLQRFIDKDQKWAHLDIAGVANTDGKQKGVAPAKGGTGTGVRTLVAMARNRAGK